MSGYLIRGFLRIIFIAQFYYSHLKNRTFCSPFTRSLLKKGCQQVAGCYLSSLWAQTLVLRWNPPTRFPDLRNKSVLIASPPRDYQHRKIPPNLQDHNFAQMLRICSLPPNIVRPCPRLWLHHRSQYQDHGRPFTGATCDCKPWPVLPVYIW